MSRRGANLVDGGNSVDEQDFTLRIKDGGDPVIKAKDTKLEVISMEDGDDL